MLKQIVAETGYNDSPWLGAEKKKVRLVTANSGSAVFAVNRVFTGQDAKEIDGVGSLNANPAALACSTARPAL